MSIALLNPEHYETLRHGIKYMPRKDALHELRYTLHSEEVETRVRLQDLSAQDIKNMVFLLAEMNATAYVNRYMRSPEELQNQFGVDTREEAISQYMREVHACKDKQDWGDDFEAGYIAKALKALRCALYQIEFSYLGGKDNLTREQDQAYALATALELALTYRVVSLSEEYTQADWFIYMSVTDEG